MAVTSSHAFKRPNFTPIPKNSAITTEIEEISSLPDLVEFNAWNNPDHIFCVQAETVHEPADVDSGTHYGVSITFKQLDNAVKCCAEWLGHMVKPGRLDENNRQRPVALYLESDVGLMFHFTALLTLGIPVLLISARLSPPSVQHLLDATKCKLILTSKRTNPMLSGQIDHSCKIESTESYTAFLNKDPALTTDGRERRRMNSEQTQNALILHSSGTTGFPKPIYLHARYPLQYAAAHEFPIGENINWINLSTLPLYHGFGFLAPCLSLSIGMACCFPPSSIIPAGRSTIDLIKTFHCQSLMTVPSIVDDLMTLENSFVYLSKLEFLAVGGGALRLEQGSRLMKHNVKLLNHYGVTEIGALAPIFRPGSDYNWRYLRLRSDLDLELRPIPGSERYKLVGWPLNWDTHFEIQDELERNAASRPEHVEVRIIGRTDDLIVLKTGEKVMPQQLESVLHSNLEIKTAVCIGQGFFEITILVEPAETMDTHGEGRLLDSLWQMVSELNPSLDRHARVSSKKAIIIKPHAKPIPRTDKGSVSRRLVHETFADEIEAAYKAIEEDAPIAVLDATDLEASIRGWLDQVFQSNVYIDTCQDLFEQGMDSLQALRLARLISSATRCQKSQGSRSETPKKLDAAFVYRHSTIQKLVVAVGVLLGIEESPKGASSRQHEQHARMEALVASFIRKIDTHRSHKPRAHVVLLTGATGNLGVHTLARLVRTKLVAKVICLYRSTSKSISQDRSRVARSRVQEALIAAGLSLGPEAWSKIHFVEDKLFLKYAYQRTHEPEFSSKNEHTNGSGTPLLHNLDCEVTQIVHLAWPMDFHRTLDSFSSHLQMVEALIDFAKLAHSRQYPGGKRTKVRILFASSIAVVRHYFQQHEIDTWACIQGAVPEIAMEKAATAATMGYSEAKWICEHMLDNSRRIFDDEIDPVVVRIGQLSGPESTDGVWKTTEHIPALLRASLSVGAVPQLGGTMSWLPVDRAAEAILDIMFHPGEHHGFLHLENPIRQPADDIMAMMAREMGLGGKDALPFEQWLQRARELGMIESLDDFFQHDFRSLALGEITLSTANSRSVSRTLRGSCGVGQELLSMYVQRWKDQGLFL